MFCRWQKLCYMWKCLSGSATARLYSLIWSHSALAITEQSYFFRNSKCINIQNKWNILMQGNLSQPFKINKKRASCLLRFLLLISRLGIDKKWVIALGLTRFTLSTLRFTGDGQLDGISVAGTLKHFNMNDWPFTASHSWVTTATVTFTLLQKWQHAENKFQL